jgi:hypothetical protein
VLLAGTGSLLAQDEDESTESDGKSYVLAYVLVFLIMTLGIVLVCRPTKRLDRPKMVEQDLEAKLDQMSGK